MKGIIIGTLLSALMWAMIILIVTSCGDDLYPPVPETQCTITLGDLVITIPCWEPLGEERE